MTQGRTGGFPGAAPLTDHAREIAALRAQATSGDPSLLASLAMLAAAELLAAHDETGISLDAWEAPRRLVEYLLQRPITPNGV